MYSQSVVQSLKRQQTCDQALALLRHGSGAGETTAVMVVEGQKCQACRAKPKWLRMMTKVRLADFLQMRWWRNTRRQGKNADEKCREKGADKGIYDGDDIPLLWQVSKRRKVSAKTQDRAGDQSAHGTRSRPAGG